MQLVLTHTHPPQGLVQGEDNRLDISLHGTAPEKPMPVHVEYYFVAKSPLFLNKPETSVVQLELSLALTETRAHWGAPFPKASVELRNQIEEVLECMKLDGTVAKLSEKWFGVAPGPDSAERTVFPGFGVPGLPGHDPAPHTPRCG